MKRTELKRKTPLKRKVELKAGKGFTIDGRKASLKRVHALAPQSEKEKLWERWRKHERIFVVERSHGFCQAWWPLPGGGRRRQVCANQGEHLHHVFGRTEEPWSSWRYMCAWLCREHHEDVTGRVGRGVDLALRKRLRVDAAVRVHMAVQIYPVADGQLTMWDADEWLWWLRTFIKHGATVPPEYADFIQSRRSLV